MMEKSRQLKSCGSWRRVIRSWRLRIADWVFDFNPRKQGVVSAKSVLGHSLSSNQVAVNTDCSGFKSANLQQVLIMGAHSRLLVSALVTWHLPSRVQSVAQGCYGHRFRFPILCCG